MTKKPASKPKGAVKKPAPGKPASQGAAKPIAAPPARAAKSAPAAPKQAQAKAPVSAKAAPEKPAAKGAAPKATPTAAAPKATPTAAAPKATPTSAAPKATPTAAAPKAAAKPAPKADETVDATPIALSAAEPKAATGAGAIAEKLVAGTHDQSIGVFGAALESDKEANATNAARVLDEVLTRKAELLVPLVDRFAHGIFSKNPRVVATASNALPVLGRIAPARVARNLEMLTGQFAEASAVGKDGLVRTFASLCAASVAYQKRLEPVIELALSGADAKELQRWTEIVLPALKGEPHARARAVVERRVNDLPKPIAQKIASFLGIKLRPTPAR